jgi:hypothetical protein
MEKDATLAKGQEEEDINATETEMERLARLVEGEGEERAGLSPTALEAIYQAADENYDRRARKRKLTRIPIPTAASNRSPRTYKALVSFTPSYTK